MGEGWERQEAEGWEEEREGLESEKGREEGTEGREEKEEKGGTQYHEGWQKHWERQWGPLQPFVILLLSRSMLSDTTLV